MAEVRTTSSTGGQKGVKLARFGLIPVMPLFRLAEHFGRGAKKYADHNWRRGYETDKSFDSLMRHAWDWQAGLTYDVCSNRPEECSFVYPDTHERAGEEYVPEEPDTCFNHTGSHHLTAVVWHAMVLQETEERYPEHDTRYIYERTQQ